MGEGVVSAAGSGGGAWTNDINHLGQGGRGNGGNRARGTSTTLKPGRPAKPTAVTYDSDVGKDGRTNIFWQAAFLY